MWNEKAAASSSAAAAGPRFRLWRQAMPLAHAEPPATRDCYAVSQETAGTPGRARTIRRRQRNNDFIVRAF